MAHADLTELLARLPLLTGVDMAVLRRVAASSRSRLLAKREIALHKGAAADGLYFVIKGRLQVIDEAAGGREVGLGFLSAGDFFGELSIIDGQPRSATVVATEPSLVIIVPVAAARELFYRQPLVAERLLKHFARKLRLTSEYQAILNLPNAYQRVCAFLTCLAEAQAGGGNVIDRLPTQHEIAIMVNTSRETVSRTLHLLIERGILQKDARRLIVQSPEELRQAAELGGH